MSNFKSPTRKGTTIIDPTALIKVSDISSKAKTSIVSAYFFLRIQKISDKNLKMIETKVREYFKTPKLPVMVGQANLASGPASMRR